MVIVLVFSLKSQLCTVANIAMLALEGKSNQDSRIYRAKRLPSFVELEAPFTLSRYLGWGGGEMM